MSENSPHGADFVGHETTDAEIGPLVRFAVSLTVTVIVCALVVIGLYKYLDERERAEKAGRYPLAAGVVRPLPPPPRLQTYPFDDIKAFRKEEAKILDHYAWVDQHGGVVRIPIERAIDVLAEKGLPYRGGPGAPGAAAATTGAEAPAAVGAKAARAPEAQQAKK